jgi:hypothetical protein
MNPRPIEAAHITQESLPTVAATAPIENSTSGGTPLATQNAPVQSMPRCRPATVAGSVAIASSAAALTSLTADREKRCYAGDCGTVRARGVEAA